MLKYFYFTITLYYIYNIFSDISEEDFNMNKKSIQSWISKLSENPFNMVIIFYSYKNYNINFIFIIYLLVIIIVSIIKSIIKIRRF